MKYKTALNLYVGFMISMFILLVLLAVSTQVSAQCHDCSQIPAAFEPVDEEAATEHLCSEAEIQRYESEGWDAYECHADKQTDMEAAKKHWLFYRQVNRFKEVNRYHHIKE